MKARNFEIFQESLNANHMGHLADSFLLASGKLQALCYKADIEAALRTPGFAGFQLLDLHDFPGQGTALVGVLDPFWEEKGYISPEEFSRFSNSTVPLARLEKQIFTEGEILKAGIEVAHFGQQPLKAVNPEWSIVHNNEVLASGTLGQTDIPVGNAISLGEVTYEFQKENLPRKLTMRVKTGDFSNAWDVWVYPADQVPETGDVRVVETLDDWVTNRRLALLFEAKVGDGKLLVSGTDLVNNLENRPEARQLLFSLKNYMTAEHFNPKVDLDNNDIKKILK